MEAISSRPMTVLSSITRTLSGTEMCRTRPVTDTYAPPAFRSSGTKYSAVASGQSGRRVIIAARRRFSSSASCEESSRLSEVSRAVSPVAGTGGVPPLFSPPRRRARVRRYNRAVSVKSSKTTSPFEGGGRLQEVALRVGKLSENKSCDVNSYNQPSCRWNFEVKNTLFRGRRL